MKLKKISEWGLIIGLILFLLSIYLQIILITIFSLCILLISFVVFSYIHIRDTIFRPRVIIERDNITITEPPMIGKKKWLKENNFPPKKIKRTLFSY